jgi:phosphoadenosine phosphosulfate reductase
MIDVAPPRKIRSDSDPVLGMTAGELAHLAEALEGRSPAEVLSRCAARFPRITFATGFGVEGCVLIDVIAREGLPIDLFTLDTGLLFPETYGLWERLEERYGVEIRAVEPEKTVPEQAALFGDRLWEREPDRCCAIRKVAPLRRAVAGFDAWVTAIRADQTATRKASRTIERDLNFGLIKVNPLLGWSAADVWSHVRRNDVPFNPLHERGYPSVGCVPCTEPVAPGEDPRAGRWRSRSKTECGLHARPMDAVAQETRSDVHAR